MSGTTHDRLAVLVVGPAAGAHGGIGSVQYLLEQRTADLVDLSVVVTHRDGSVATRLRAIVGGTLRALVRVLLRPPDVVHLHLSQRMSVFRKGLILTVARWRGVPSVLHVHGSGLLDWFDGLSPAVRRLVRFLLRPTRVVVLSASLVPEYRARLAVDPDAVLALPNPVEVPDAVPPKPDDVVVAAFLGRFGARKGIYDVLAAVAGLAPDVRDRFRLVAAGDGEVDEVRARVASLGLGDVVDVRGWIDRAERNALLARAHLLVLPSSHEGLPMAVLEAMAWGAVPVVTAVGGIPEVVHDGVNGVHVPVGDPATLQGALAELVSDVARRDVLSNRAREDVTVLSADRWTRRLVDVWTAAPGRT